MSAFRGRNVINGTWAELYWNNKKIMELSKYSAKINAEREDIPIGMSMDSKLTITKGEGSLEIKKVYSRYKKEVLDAYKRGEDVRFNMLVRIKDPDAIRKQAESHSIDNIWFNEFPVAEFEQKTPMNEEWTFGFTPEDVDIIEEIKE